MEKGMKVKVFEDPITCKNLEGIATVTRVLRRESWNDEYGNPVVRCNVRFMKAECVYERDVSQAAD
jgi:hypothetical protein